MPLSQFLWVFQGEYGFDHGHNEELHDEALLQQRGELRECFWQPQISEGTVERFQSVPELVEIVFQGLMDRKGDVTMKHIEGYKSLKRHLFSSCKTNSRLQTCNKNMKTVHRRSTVPRPSTTFSSL